MVSMPHKKGSFISQARKLLGDHFCFLPPTIPLRHLPEAFSSIENACRHISVDYSFNGLGVRHALNRLFCSIDKQLLQRIPSLSQAQQQCLMNMLSILAHCYRWDRSPPNDDCVSATKIDFPPGLDALWRATANACGQPLVGTNTSLKYWNWHLVGRKPGEPYQSEDLLRRKVSVNFLWLNGEANIALENWIMSFILAEAGGANVIKNLLYSIEFAIDSHLPACQQSLYRLYHSMQQFSQLLGHLFKGSRVDIESWLEQIQQTFIWGIEDAATGETLQGSGDKQVGVIQAMQLGLTNPDPAGLAQMRTETWRYFLPDHQRFLDMLATHAHTLHQFVNEHESLTGIYNDCIHELTRWHVIQQKKGAWYVNRSESLDNRTSTAFTQPDENDCME